jgi:hypothetical protein
MGSPAKCVRSWVGLAGTLGLALSWGGVATADDHPAGCKTCQAYYGQASAAGHVHVAGQQPALPADYPRGSDGSPMVYEHQSFVDRLLGRKQYSIPVYHQTGSGALHPEYQSAMAATQMGGHASMGSMMAEHASPDGVMPAVAYGEPAPIGIMRTDYQAMAAEHAAAFGQPAGAPTPGLMSNRGVVPSQPMTHDPRIDMWHTKIRSGTSMVAGGGGETLLMRLTDGETPLSRWREARKTRRTLRAYGTLAPVPMGGPSAGMMPGMGMGAPH